MGCSGLKVKRSIRSQVLRVLILDLAKKTLSAFRMFKFLGGCHVLI